MLNEFERVGIIIYCSGSKNYTLNRPIIKKKNIYIKTGGKFSQSNKF